MQTKVLSYRIIIEPEKQGRKIVYNAYCPTLGLADWDHSIDKAVKNIQSLIKFHIENLLRDGQQVPQENTERELIMSTKVSIKSIKESGQDYQVLVG